MRRCAHRLERCVEVAEVRWPKHELGQQPGQRARLEAHRPSLPVERRVGDPAAATAQVQDDVAGGGMRLDPRGDEAGRGRWGEPIEERQRKTGLGSDEGRAARHVRQRTPVGRR